MEHERDVTDYPSAILRTPFGVIKKWNAQYIFICFHFLNMPKLKGNYCNVDGCVNRSEDDEDQRHYYRLPAIISHLKDFEKDLGTERRRLWLSQLNKDLTGKNLANIRICSDHFVNSE